MTNRPTADSGHFHAVRFYESSDALSRIVADFIGEGLAARLPGIVIATPEHSALIDARLRTAGFDTEQLKAADELIMIDASVALTEFMVDGMPDPRRFRRVMIPLLERAGQGRTNCVIRAYGEIVDVLWKLGNTVAAVRLEMLWNELAQTHEFALLCGYAMGSFYKRAEAIPEITSHHSHVISSEGTAAIPR
jgi:hypothetical protein